MVLSATREAKDKSRGRRARAGRKTGGQAPLGDGAVRERLLSSATRLFNRKGYAAASVREIVADAGVTKPVLYYYFESKEGIFLSLVREAFGRVDALLDDTRARPGDAKERIKGLADRLYRLFVERIEVARLIYAIYYGPPQGTPAFDFDAIHVKFREAMRRLVEEGVARGEFRPKEVETMTWAVIGAVNVALEIRLCHPDIAMGPDGLARVLDLVFRGMEAGPSPRGRVRRGGAAGNGAGR